MKKSVIALTINGTESQMLLQPGATLLEALRESQGLTGTRRGCEQGACGTCTVLVDGKPMLACLLSAETIEGMRIDTIEGLTPAQGLHPIQQAWIDEQVPQCGFCQNGQIMTAKALLDRNPHPTDSQIRTAMANTLCRCMTYYRVQAAIKRASKGVVA